MHKIIAALLLLSFTITIPDSDVSKSPLHHKNTLEKNTFRDFSFGGTSGTITLSVLTGILMTCALKIVSRAHGDNGPLMFGIFSSGLLLSLYDFVTHSIGKEYGGLACWGALATNITTVMAIRILNND